MFTLPGAVIAKIDAALDSSGFPKFWGGGPNKVSFPNVGDAFFSRVNGLMQKAFGKQARINVSGKRNSHKVDIRYSVWESCGLGQHVH